MIGTFAPPLALSIDFTWNDVVKFTTIVGVLATLFAVWRGGRKAISTLAAILDVVEQIGEVKVELDTLRAESNLKHDENSVRLDALTSHIANQESTSKYLGEVIGKPVQQIAEAMTRRDPPGSTA